MPATGDDFSVFEQIRATASRRVRLRLGLPSSLRRSAPLELLLVAPAWLSLCAWKPDPPWPVIGMQTLALVVMAAALIYLRRIGSRPLEIGWRMILFAQLIAALDSITLEPGLPEGALPQLCSALWALGGLGLIWGLRLDRVRRAADIERLKHAVTERRLAHRRFVDLVDTVDGVVWEAAAEPFKFHFVSRRAGLILGFKPQIWIQQPNLWFERIHHEDREMVMAHVADKARKLEAYRLEYRMIAADGRTVWVRDIVNIVKDADGTVKLRGVTVDVTETKQLEQRLRHSANHDALTGLPNRVAFTEALERAFRKNSASTTFAVLFLDLDRFKIVNDTLGHMAGDTVLKETAVRVLRAVRSRDVVARLGGDEFAVLAENLHASGEAVELANRLRQELNRPVEVGGRKFTLSASIGIKLARPGAGSAKEILRDADTAMYCAKENARGSQQVFASEMHDKLMADVETEGELRAGLDGQRLDLRYKPIVDIVDGRTFGYEIALYCRDRHGQQFCPDRYAAIAEQSGLAGPLGWACLHHAFLAAGPLDEPAPVIVAPLSVVLLRQTDLLEQIDDQLRETAAKPDRLVLALPEEAAAAPDSQDVLQALRERGFRIGLASLGAGRASLRELWQLPLSFARLDPRYLQQEAKGARGGAMLQSMIALCQGLNVEVIADGLESPSQIAVLRRLGCRLAQGPHYGAPRKAEDLDRIGAQF